MIVNAIKIAWKVLLRHPFYTFITLFGISLTLTVLMVLTSFLDHLIGAHYPETKRDRSLYIQMMIQSDSARSGQNQGPMSFDFLTRYAKTLKTPERVTISSLSLLNMSSAYVGSRKINIYIKFTDADFWKVIDFDFLEGKSYNKRNIANGDYVAVITDSFKQQYFDGADGPVVGKAINIENVRYKIIGVVKSSPITRLFTHADVYFPYTAPKSNYRATGMRGDYMAIILAKNKRDFQAIQDEFKRHIAQIPLPGSQNGFTYSSIEVPSEPYLQTFLETILRGGNGVKTIFFGVIFLLAFMLLGLPAINLVNINVSRILERASEIGIRKAFGAPIRTLLWQFIVENIFITFIGGAIALILTAGVIYLINTSGWIAHADLSINLTVFLISLLICLLFGLLSGVLPALRMSRLSIADALKN